VYSRCLLFRRGPYPIPLRRSVSSSYLSLVLQFYDGLLREMRAKLLPPILVYLHCLWLHRLPKAQPGFALKPRGRIEFSVGGLALVSFFTGSGRLSSDFHGGVLQLRFFMRYRLTRYHGIPLHILGSQSREMYSGVGKAKNINLSRPREINGRLYYLTPRALHPARRQKIIATGYSGYSCYHNWLKTFQSFVNIVADHHPADRFPWSMHVIVLCTVN